MDEFIDALMGIDKRKEILTLWYEITYLRMIISQIIPAESVCKINLEKIKIDAQECVRKRFPDADLVFYEQKL